MDRKLYMKDYYSKRRSELRNNSLIYSHKNKIQTINKKGPDLKKYIDELLNKNPRRKVDKVYIVKKKVCIRFD